MGGLDEVMRRLYINLAKKNKGYSRTDYENISSEVAGCDLGYLFNDLIDSPVEYTKQLEWAFEKVGLALIAEEDKALTKNFGLKGTYKNGSFNVSDVALGSDAAKFNINRGDVIKSVNGYSVKDDLDKWLAYFGEEKQELGIIRESKHGAVVVQPTFKNGYMNYKINQEENASKEQKDNFEKWLNK